MSSGRDRCAVEVVVLQRLKPVLDTVRRRAPGSRLGSSGRVVASTARAAESLLRMMPLTNKKIDASRAEVANGKRD
jgi:hypothetical protein